MAVMNKYVLHSGKHLPKGSECPKDLVELMVKQGHADEAKKEEKKPADKKEK